MDKNECKELVELLSVTWDKPLDAASITARAKGYWEYIQDLDFYEVKETVTNLGIVGRRWMPRPGELRLEVLAKTRGETLPPEPEEAWTMLQAISQKIYNGTNDYLKPHPVLAETIRRLGQGATRLTTNSDRNMFTTIYEKTRETYIKETYGN